MVLDIIKSQTCEYIQSIITREADWWTREIVPVLCTTFRKAQYITCRLYSNFKNYSTKNTVCCTGICVSIYNSTSFTAQRNFYKKSDFATIFHSVLQTFHVRCFCIGDFIPKRIQWTPGMDRWTTRQKKCVSAYNHIIVASKLSDTLAKGLIIVAL